MTTRRKLTLLGIGAICGLAIAVIGLGVGWREAQNVLARTGVLHELSPEEYERWARQRFHELHPDEEPLNWRIARTALRLHEARPMGRFVLHENDCSDFVGCVIDEALGAGARFNRDSDEHLLCGSGGSLRRELFVRRRLPDMGPVQPGDIVSVRHSPHYPPHDDSIGHVGVIGPDGRVLDFTKLKSWPSARYTRTDFEWFIRHCAPEEVIIGRLRPEFRYRVLEIDAVRLGMEKP